LSAHTFSKKIRDAQIEQYNYILVVGEKELKEDVINIRSRDKHIEGSMPLTNFIDKVALDNDD
jgi:threonyl-tRNA synthetase